MLSEYSNQIIEVIIDAFDLYENDPVIMEVTDLLATSESFQYDIGFKDGVDSILDSEDE